MKGPLQCKIKISDSLFENNTASNIGGAIYYTQNWPSLDNNTFKNNSASYGPDIGSFGLRFSLNDQKV